MPVRVLSVHRTGLDVAGPGLAKHVPPLDGCTDDEAATIGDWLLLDARNARSLYACLNGVPCSSGAPRASPRAFSLIAANVDTLFIVSSCNQDFNPARLERYLSLAREAGSEPVIVLTKADQAEDPAPFADKARRRLLPGLFVETLDARDRGETKRLAVWCGTGQTVAMLGSSGVGKSTLVNTLTGHEAQSTNAIREDDAKGRHTTTGRSLHRLPSGGWLMDTPGMREIQLTDADGSKPCFLTLPSLPPTAVSTIAVIRANQAAPSRRQSKTVTSTRIG